MNPQSGTLYIIATPIGNLDDISSRAIEVLSKVDICASEDTRKSKILFDHYQIKTRLISYHKFSERKKLSYFIDQLNLGKNIALISDAGTPLISDPGHILVEQVLAENINIKPIPGVSAVTSALSVSGLPIENFIFYGFPPRKGKERFLFLEKFNKEDITSVIFESGLRIEKFLAEIIAVTPEREVFISREMTKVFETFYRGSVVDVLQEIVEDSYGTKGEFVLIFSGIKAKNLYKEYSIEERRIIDILLKNLPNKTAFSLASKILQVNKNKLYKNFIDNKD
jgi:16S rRNA (cytidine1402-2'-O)-methyltransferase|tara:strand:- start:109 stop:954 length:846 start_codon:yes stop_codon:yes gene_type:complete